MPSFSFDQDIAPMRGSFFQSRLSGRENSYLQKKYGPDMKEAKAMLDIQGKMQDIRNSDLQYEKNLLALQTAKEKSANERDAYGRLPQLMGDITAIKDNAELDPYAKQAKYGELALQYPHLLTTNKVAGTMVSGAMGVNDLDIKRLDNEDRKAYKSFSLMTQMPDMASAAEIAAQDGFSDVEKAWLQGKGRVTDAKERKEYMAWKKTQRDEAASQLKTQQGATKSIQDEMYGLKMMGVEEQAEGWVANRPQGNDDAAKKAQKEYEKQKPTFTEKLSEIDALRVQTRARELDIDPRDIESMTPEKLRIAVVKKANRIDQAIKQQRGLTSPRENRTAAGGVYENRNR